MLLLIFHVTHSVYKVNVYKMNMLTLVGKINSKIIPLESVIPSSHLILCCLLLLLPSILPSIRVFSRGTGCLHQVARVLELHFSVSPSNDYSGLISFRMDLFDLCAVPGILESLLQPRASVSHTFYLFLYLSLQNCFHCPFL